MPKQKSINKIQEISQNPPLHADVPGGKSKILITGGAGFIGSNLCEYFLYKGHSVTCLDDFSTGFRHNIEPFLKNSNFELVQGDIRNLETCHYVSKEKDYILHHAALGSVPRSINDPVATNEVNIGGFLNILVAARDAGVKRLVFAASSSTYGDSNTVPKVEEVIGKPLSPYAVTKLVNELYADIFSKTYGLDYIGLRYFNVFGRRQDPAGAYAAVIPNFILKLINHQSPIINGTGDYSRDFTYIDNVIQMNERAMLCSNADALNTIYNTAVGESTSLNKLADYLKYYLAEYDSEISAIKFNYGKARSGDIPHSLACIEKAKKRLGYSPSHTVQQGLKESVHWYWEHLRP